jgi:hypothetical protein
VSVVRPEYGPTLPQLLAPHVRRLPRPVQLVLAIVVAAGILLAAWTVMGPGTNDRSRHVIERPFAFNLAWGSGVQRVEPRPGEVLRLETPPGTEAPQSFTVKHLAIAPYPGDVSAALMGLSTPAIEELRAAFPEFLIREEGRVNINRQPGYQVWFQARQGGRTVYGRRILIVFHGDPDRPREGADILLVSARSPTVPKYTAVGSNGVLKTPLRSFRFGTEAP